MRPTPDEVIEGVRAVLRDVIAPELTSEHAKARLAEVRAVLAQVEWSDAGLALARRNAAIVEVLEAVAIRIDVDVPAVAADTFAGHQAAYQELAGAAIAALGTIAARLAEHGDPQLEELRLRVLRALV